MMLPEKASPDSRQFWGRFTRGGWPEGFKRIQERVSAEKVIPSASKANAAYIRPAYGRNLGLPTGLNVLETKGISHTVEFLSPAGIERLILQTMLHHRPFVSTMTLLRLAGQRLIKRFHE